MSSEESEHCWISDTDSKDFITNFEGYVAGLNENDHEDGQTLTEPVAGTSTGSLKRMASIYPSPVSSQPDSSKKRKKSGTAGKSPLAPKKRKKPLHSRGVGRSSLNNGDNLSSEGSGDDANSDSEENLNVTSTDDERRRTTAHFSIHRLPVRRLCEFFKPNDEGEPKEEDLIEAIMKAVNERQGKSNEKNGKTGLFEKITTAEIPTGGFGLSAEDAQEALFEFKILFFRQFTTVKTDIKVMYNIHEDSPYENTIWFYYRPGDIYAMTIKSSWQLIQVYSCYEFPSQISGRLTGTEGSFQEILIHLTGNVSASQSVKKNSMNYDKLNSVVLNVIKSLRDDCSLYGLKEFTGSTRKKDKVKLQIGLGYVRIKRRMDHRFLPEILNHFTKICRGEDTYTFPANLVEKQLDDVPYLHGVFGEVEQSANKELLELIKQYVRNENHELAKKFYLSDTFREDFFNAEDYKMTSNKKIVFEFPACPTLYQVFEVIKEKWGSELRAGSRRSGTFENRIKKYVKIEYKAKGSAVPTSRPLLSLLEGEMTLVKDDVWKLMGKWMVVREDYYRQIHVKFLDLLKRGKGKDEIFRNARRAHLIKDWNIENVKSVKDYLKQYETEKRYFFPPPPNANSSANNESCVVSSSHFFDMLKVSRVKGMRSFWLFYVFDRYDAGIRDASVRITKSLEMMLPKDGSTSKDGSLLKKFWCHQTDKFRTLFGNLESFCDAIRTTEHLNIVVAFATQYQQLNSRALAAGMASQSLRQEDDLPTLMRERELRLDIPKDELVELIYANVHLDELCGDLQIAPVSNMANEDFYKLMATQVLERLVARGYFTQFVSDSEKFRYEVTGSFLKLRKHDAFKMSNDHATNQKYATLFRKLQQLCTSGFPGFTHKLECFQIHESITLGTLTRMKLYISEIL